MSIIEYFAIIIFFLFFSAIFSASETAFLSLDAVKIKRIQKRYSDVHFVVGLLTQLQRFLTTILIGNMLVNITLTAFLTSLCLKAFGSQGLAFSIVVATFLVLIFGEVVPKVLATKKPEDFAYSIARFITLFSVIIHPLSSIFNAVSKAIMNVVGLRLISEPSLTHEELKSVIEMSHREGLVKENEKEMIRSVLELTRTSVFEIMTPRPDIKALSFDRTQEEALRRLKKIQHSKFPVYKETVDNIVGILYAKDLFLSPEKDFKAFIKPAVFVPETRKIDDLLKDFQSQNIKIAIVVDEYGSVCGLVTLEDILEEIVGEIYDEYETKENFIAPLGGKVFRISGKTSVYYVNEVLQLGIPPGDYDTIAGYMLFLFGKIPREGERVKKDALSYCVETMAGRRIKSILLEKL